MAKAEALVESNRKIKPPPLPSSQRQSNPVEQSWKTPPVGCFKLKVDLATKRQNQVACLGAVIRDCKGNFIAAARKQENFNGVSAVEARAIQLGMEVAENAGCMPLIIESDCQQAVNLVLGRECSKCEISCIISNIQEGLKRHNMVIIYHFSRLCNDTIAKMALGNVESIMWTNNCPAHQLFLFSIEN